MKDIVFLLLFFCFCSVTSAELSKAFKFTNHVSAGASYTCALDDEGVKCWGWNYSGQTDVPELKNPRQVDAGDRHTCALDDEGVKCWGDNSDGQTDVPVLKNPRQVSAGNRHTCAHGDEGVKCWGWNEFGQTDVSELLLVNYYHYYSLAIESSVFSKSTFLQSLEKFRESDLEQTTSLDIKKIFLLISIGSPAVLGTDSDYFKTKVIPGWNSSMTWLKKKINFPTNQDPLLAIEGTLENRTLALTAIQSSLDVSLSFLSGKQIDRTQDALRKVGQALIDPMNNQNILEAVKSVESLTEERAVLLSSEKSKFLIESQQVAINWLKLKVK